MKTTSKIIIGFVAALVLLAIFWPFIFFTSVVPKKDDSRNVLSLTDSTVTITPGQFNKLTFDQSLVALIYTDNDSYDYESTVLVYNSFEDEPLHYVIKEDPEAKEPRIEMNSSWADNLMVDIDSDGQVTLFPDMHRLKENDPDLEVVYIYPDNNVVATIYVPKGMLKMIEPHGFRTIEVSLNGISEPISVMNNSNLCNLYFSECNISDIYIKNIERIYAEFEKSQIYNIFYDGNQEGVSNYLGITNTTNSSIENLYLYGGECRADISEGVSLRSIILSPSTDTTSTMTNYQLTCPKTVLIKSEY